MFFRKQYSRKICSTSFDCKVSFQDAAFLEQTGLLSNLKQPQRNVVFCCRLHFEIEDTSFLSASVGSVASCFLAVHVSLIFEMFIEGTSLTRTNKDKNSRHLGARVAYAYIYEASRQPCGGPFRSCYLAVWKPMHVDQWFSLTKPWLHSSQSVILSAAHMVRRKIASNLNSNRSYFFIAWPNI